VKSETIGPEMKSLFLLEGCCGIVDVSCMMAFMLGSGLVGYQVLAVRYPQG